MFTHNLGLSPFQRGEAAARSGGMFYFPYDDHKNNMQYKRGWDAQKRRSAGVRPGQEQPLP